jgi:GH18 family chitinase
MEAILHGYADAIRVYQSRGQAVDAPVLVHETVAEDHQPSLSIGTWRIGLSWYGRAWRAAKSAASTIAAKGA